MFACLLPSVLLSPSLIDLSVAVGVPQYLDELQPADESGGQYHGVLSFDELRAKIVATCNSRDAVEFAPGVHAAVVYGVDSRRAEVGGDGFKTEGRAFLTGQGASGRPLVPLRHHFGVVWSVFAKSIEVD